MSPAPQRSSSPPDRITHRNKSPRRYATVRRTSAMHKSKVAVNSTRLPLLIMR
jgi:hypothetical protein